MTHKALRFGLPAPSTSYNFHLNYSFCHFPSLLPYWLLSASLNGPDMFLPQSLCTGLSSNICMNFSLTPSGSYSRDAVSASVYTVSPSDIVFVSPQSSPCSLSCFTFSFCSAYHHLTLYIYFFL